MLASKRKLNALSPSFLLRQLIHDPNCEMAHRQESFGLVVLKWMVALVGLGQQRAKRSRKRLRHEVELTALLRAVRFRLRRIVMRGFNRTATVMCASLILESTLSG